MPAGLDFGDGRFGGGNFLGGAVDFDGNIEDLLLAGGQFDDAVFGRFKRAGIGKIRARFQAGDVAIGLVGSVLPKRKPGELLLVKDQADSARAMGVLQ